MTLDEAIVHTREVAERNRKQYKNCPSDRTDIRYHICEECAEEHEQLAEWLEELQMYKSLSPRELISEKQKNDRAIEYSKGFNYGFNIGYNKAIDEFAKWLENKKYLMKEIQVHDFCYTHYDELKANCVTTEYFAEQLKGEVASKWQFIL